jgi:hypothetical protein
MTENPRTKTWKIMCVSFLRVSHTTNPVVVTVLGFRENSIPIQYSIFPTGSIAKDIHIE